MAISGLRPNLSCFPHQVRNHPASRYWLAYSQTVGPHTWHTPRLSLTPETCRGSGGPRVQGKTAMNRRRQCTVTTISHHCQMQPLSPAVHSPLCPLPWCKCRQSPPKVVVHGARSCVTKSRPPGRDPKKLLSPGKEENGPSAPSIQVKRINRSLLGNSSN